MKQILVIFFLLCVLTITKPLAIKREVRQKDLTGQATKMQPRPIPRMLHRDKIPRIMYRHLPRESECLRRKKNQNPLINSSARLTKPTKSQLILYRKPDNHISDQGFKQIKSNINKRGKIPQRNSDIIFIPIKPWEFSHNFIKNQRHFNNNKLQLSENNINQSSRSKMKSKNTNNSNIQQKNGNERLPNFSSNIPVKSIKTKEVLNTTIEIMPFTISTEKNQNDKVIEEANNVNNNSEFYYHNYRVTEEIKNVSDDSEFYHDYRVTEEVKNISDNPENFSEAKLKNEDNFIKPEETSIKMDVLYPSNSFLNLPDSNKSQYHSYEVEEILEEDLRVVDDDIPNSKPTETEFLKPENELTPQEIDQMNLALGEVKDSIGTILQDLINPMNTVIRNEENKINKNFYINKQNLNPANVQNPNGNNYYFSSFLNKFKNLVRTEDAKKGKVLDSPEDFLNTDDNFNKVSHGKKEKTEIVVVLPRPLEIPVAYNLKTTTNNILNSDDSTDLRNLNLSTQERIQDSGKQNKFKDENVLSFLENVESSYNTSEVMPESSIEQVLKILVTSLRPFNKTEFDSQTNPNTTFSHLNTFSNISENTNLTTTKSITKLEDKKVEKNLNFKKDLKSVHSITGSTSDNIDKTGKFILEISDKSLDTPTIYNSQNRSNNTSNNTSYSNSPTEFLQNMNLATQKIDQRFLGLENENKENVQTEEIDEFLTSVETFGTTTLYNLETTSDYDSMELDSLTSNIQNSDSVPSQSEQRFFIEGLNFSEDLKHYVSLLPDLNTETTKLSEGDNNVSQIWKNNNLEKSTDYNRLPEFTSPNDDYKNLDTTPQGSRQGFHIKLPISEVQQNHELNVVLQELRTHMTVEDFSIDNYLSTPSFIDPKSTESEEVTNDYSNSQDFYETDFALSNYFDYGEKNLNSEENIEDGKSTGILNTSENPSSLNFNQQKNELKLIEKSEELTSHNADEEISKSEEIVAEKNQDNTQNHFMLETSYISPDFSEIDSLYKDLTSQENIEVNPFHSSIRFDSTEDPYENDISKQEEIKDNIGDEQGDVNSSYQLQNYLLEQNLAENSTYFITDNINDSRQPHKYKFVENVSHEHGFTTETINTNEEVEFSTKSQEFEIEQNFSNFINDFTTRTILPEDSSDLYTEPQNVELETYYPDESNVLPLENEDLLRDGIVYDDVDLHRQDSIFETNHTNKQKDNTYSTNLNNNDNSALTQSQDLLQNNFTNTQKNYTEIIDLYEEDIDVSTQPQTTKHNTSFSDFKGFTTETYVDDLMKEYDDLNIYLPDDFEYLETEQEDLSTINLLLEERTEQTISTEKQLENSFIVTLLPRTIEIDKKNSHLETNWKNSRKMNFNQKPSKLKTLNPGIFEEHRRSDVLINDAVEDYNESTNFITSFNYIDALKDKNVVTPQNFTLNYLIPVIPNIITDLKMNKILPENVEILSQVFGKYWRYIEAMSNATNLDMLPLLKMKNEDDFKNILHSFGMNLDEDTTVTMEYDNNYESIDNYMNEYKELYDDILGDKVNTAKDDLRYKRQHDDSLWVMSTDSENYSDIREPTNEYVYEDVSYNDESEENKFPFWFFEILKTKKLHNKMKKFI